MKASTLCIVCNCPIDEHDIAQGSECVRKIARLKLESGIPTADQKCQWCKKPATRIIAGRPHCGNRHATPKSVPSPFNVRPH